VVNTEAVTTNGETSVGNITQVDRDNNGTPRGRNGIDVGGRIDTGTNIVVNLSKRVLTDAEVSLLSKGLKFCPTRERIDVYNVRKDIKEYIRRIRLRKFFLF